MPKTWAEEVRKGTISNDFTPDNQDQFALARLRYRGLLDEVQSGDTSWIDSRAMGREWASFPNSPYGQPTHSSSDLRSYYYEKLNEYQSSD
jgi:muramidase (phage lysozyme)